MTFLVHLPAMVHAWLHTPIGKAAIAGSLTAAAIDFKAFRTWKTWHDVATYSWSTATFRWCQGAIVGMCAAAGFQALF